MYAPYIKLYYKLLYVKITTLLRDYPSHAAQSAVLDPKSPLITESVLR